MDSIEAARATASAIGGIPSNFMLDGATYARGAELGFDGVDFYVAGRAGVLGDVDAGIVVAAFAVFEPGMVAGRWEQARSVMPVDRAAREFAACGYSWSEARLAGAGAEVGRLGELAGAVSASAAVGLAPVFAGWRALPEPDAPAARALHHLNALRELRFARHVAALTVVGLTPLEALVVRTPFMAGVFGWSEPYPDPEPCRARWEEAEAMTDRMMARELEVLDAAERAEFVGLCAAAEAAVAASAP